MSRAPVHISFSAFVFLHYMTAVVKLDISKVGRLLNFRVSKGDNKTGFIVVLVSVLSLSLSSCSIGALVKY